MPTESLREALRLLKSTPVLWVPGLAAGASAAAIWLLAQWSGLFLASRFLILAALALVFLVTGMLVIIRDGSGGIGELLAGGTKYYFRVLIPQLVIVFMLLVLFFLLAVTFGFLGAAADPGFVATLTLCVMIPTLLLTFFFDIAAVFEDRKVFASIQRSAAVVSDNVLQVLGFYLALAITTSAIFIALMFVWEIALFERLAPLADYTPEQIQSFTFEQLMSMIGTGGVWATAAVLFLGGLLLVPFAYTYKACFFRRLAGGSPEQQVTGEYDSKGRWYKY